ncbi:EexN family lipoprotein [Pseudomonas sp. LPH60]|uniref:EexN family lipoprotein n=1 Tax=Pseudomonas sp. LPH60 TaxID=3065906 RepID=UPI00273C7B73|nr:EexN family lipoprotein [Pseudomonas sp. LPH60]MDP4573448.1 EexN family lipoprotein [Pseudomonas sp. LPH60]
MKKIFTLVVIATALSGCGDSAPVQTVDWYKGHEVERKEMIAKCDDNPGQTAMGANCTNAKQADNEKANARRGWLTPTMPGSPNKGE